MLIHGFKVAGWYIYQESNQHANWGTDYVYNPDYTQMYFIETGADGMLTLNIPSLSFGDIVLIAKYEPALSNLTITRDKNAPIALTYDENQMFLYEIRKKDDTLSMVVSVQANGSVTVADLPVGEYTVTEITDWSWRYEPQNSEWEVTLTDPRFPQTVSFVNKTRNPHWLSGDSVHPITVVQKLLNFFKMNKLNGGT